MKLGLTGKILLQIGVCVVLFFVVTVFLIRREVREIEKENSKDSVVKQAEGHGVEVTLRLTEGINSLTLMRDLFELAFNNPSAKITRDMLNNAIDSVLDQNPSLFGVWYTIDVNSPQAQKLNLKPNPNGDIDYYIGYTGQDGEKERQFTAFTETEPEPYYQVPKRTKTMYITDPYIDSEISAAGVFMNTITLPVLKNGEFIGVVGIDFKMNVFQLIIEKLNSEIKGYSALISADGTIIAHKYKELIGKKIGSDFAQMKANPDYKDVPDNLLKGIVMPSAMYSAIMNGKDYSEERFSQLLQENSYYFKKTITLGVGENVTQWSILSVVSEASLYANAKNAVNYLLIINILSFLVIMALVLFISISITKPIKEIAKKIIAIGEGDLTQRLNIKSQDELGELSNKFNLFAQNIQEIIETLRENSNALNKSSADLSQVSNQMSNEVHEANNSLEKAEDSVTELNGTAKKVLDEMNNATLAVTSVQAAIDEMTVTIGEIAQNSGKAKSYTEDVSKSIADVTSRMQELDKAANEISKVTATINAISSQTNLLALNATIEAARAGEAGKGFAVVANEIKELAQQTGNATEDIRKKIEGIQNATSMTITNTEEVVKNVDEVSSVVMTIAAAIEEQHAVTHDISKSMYQVSSNIKNANDKAGAAADHCQQVSQNVSLATQSTDNVEDGSNDVKQNASALLQLAKQLQGLISRFQV
ncbi:MAG: methyl-accepting chemotaxis protein [Deltaproteobacteria bacterium]|nr:methyl-accepting chemotaxis protein [Deltaproteobacteria bacterium]